MNALHISLTEFRFESRVLKESKSLLEAGVFSKIYVVALSADDLPDQQVYSQGVLLKRLQLRTRKLGRFLGIQLIKYLEFGFKILRTYKGKGIGVVNVHALELLPLGVLLKYYFNAILVYEAHELETEKNGRHGLRKWLSKRIEKALITHADLIIVVSESIADWYVEKYRISRPLVIFNVPKVRDRESKRNHFRKKLPIRDDQTIFLYQGALVKGRGVELVLNAFKGRRDDGVVVVFMGYGDLEKCVRQAADQRGNIFWHPPVPYDVVLDYTSSADVGLCVIENTCLSYFYCMPNKLFEYAMAGLPVVVSNMYEMASFVRENSMGAVAQEVSDTGVNAAIEEVLSKDLVLMGENAHRVARAYSWESQEQKMLKAYRELLGKSCRGGNGAI